MEPDKPVTLEGLAEQTQILAIHISGIANGLELCAGALRDIYECVSRIEANQKKGTAMPHSGVGVSTRFPSVP